MSVWDRVSDPVLPRSAAIDQQLPSPFLFVVGVKSDGERYDNRRGISDLAALKGRGFSAPQRLQQNKAEVRISNPARLGRRSSLCSKPRPQQSGDESHPFPVLKVLPGDATGENRQTKISPSFVENEFEFFPQGLRN